MSNISKTSQALEASQAKSWFAFIAWNYTFFSSTVNPIIYYLRTSRFRSAFKQFLKDPFGSSDFREKPGGQGNGKENRALEGAGITKENDDEEANGSGSQEKYHGEQINGIIIHQSSAGSFLCPSNQPV